MKKISGRWFYIFLIVIVAVSMSYFSKIWLNIDFNVIESLPKNDPVIIDAKYVIMHHPVKDRIVIDLSLNKKDPDALVQGASIIEKRLSSSGHFKNVGMSQIQHVMPELIEYIMNNLPIMFTEEDLNQKVEPLLKPEKIKEAISNNYLQLLNLEGIGQSNMMTYDPLGLKNIILSKLSYLAPSRNIQIYRGYLISPDSKHLLITAEPAGSGTDTEFARKLSALIKNIDTEINIKFKPNGLSFKLTPVGAYRAALDNEETAKKDTQMAVIIATIGIAILLFVGFPRPYIGLLALLPALLGTVAALFIYSLFNSSISILAIGFGGTIISFTVDYGIAYLLFLDRPYETYGMEATKEVWSLGLLAMLTTAVSFAFLFISDFSALAQIGYFSALGVVLTYIFVHTIFPVIFPKMPPAKREGFVPLQNMVNIMMSSKGKYKLIVALLFGFIMLFFAKPEFRVDLNSMNTVSRDTLNAEKLLKDVWGDVLGKIYLMIEGDNLEDIQKKGDEIAGKLDQQVSSGFLSSAFVPSMIFPGKERMNQNLVAWRKFWTQKRVSTVKNLMKAYSIEIGFSQDAFDPFFKIFEKKNFQVRFIPKDYFTLFGIHKIQNESKWALFSVLTPGASYKAEDFFIKFSAIRSVKVFDPQFFSSRLGAIMLSGFIKMSLIVGAITILVAFLYLLDLKLTLVALTPTLFSLVCTLGTLNILGEKPGIPTIMVTVIIIGMGSDYALYLVRAYQRYMDESHPSLGLIRMTVFLSAASTMIGFGVLTLADHSLLKSAGITLLLGIGYSFIGTILIVPPILKRILVPIELPVENFIPGSKKHIWRVKKRYRLLEPYPRVFAYFKLKLDPLFFEIIDILKSPKRILDIGTGYGVPSVWIREMFPDVRIYGIEPNKKKCFIASRAVGELGTISVGKAPDIPDIQEGIDTVLMIDMAHYLTDEELTLTLEKVWKKLLPKGLLIMRTTIPLDKRFPLLRWIEIVRSKIFYRLKLNFRTEERIKQIVSNAGFSVTVKDSSEKSREEKWFTGIKSKRKKIKIEL